MLASNDLATQCEEVVMASKNVDTLRAAHQSFNRRDFDAVLRAMAENFSYRDHARGVTFSGREGFREFMQGWVTAFSNAQVTEANYIDAGQTVIAQFTGRGRNDGPLGPLPPTNRSMTLPLCEIFRFDAQGRIVAGAAYYDQMTMLTQLGHAHAPGVATVG
jgi:steroid delta-isomerase-like uncharacterized protein